MKWICIMLAMAIPAMAQESFMSDGSSEDTTVFAGAGAEAEMARHLDRVAERAERKLIREARPQQEKGGLTTSQKQIAEREKLARRPFTPERTSSQKRLDARAAEKRGDKPAEALPAPKIVVQPIANPLAFVGQQPPLGALPPAPAGAEEPPLPLESRPEAGNPNMRDFATRLDRLEFSVIQARPMPEEIMNIIPMQVGLSTNDPVLKLSAGVDGNNAAYWGPPVDQKVAVTEASDGDYLGPNSSDGVLRTESSINYDANSDGGGGYDYITLGVDPTWLTNNIGGIISNDFGYGYITNLVGAGITNHTDLLFGSSAALGTGKSGGNTDHDDSYWHAVADGSGGSHTNYTDGKSYATTGTVAVGTLIATDVTATNLTFRESLTGPGVNAWDAEDFYVDVTAFVDIESDSDMSILSYGGNLTAGVATGTGYAYLGSSAGNLMFYAGSNTIFNDVTCATEADGTNDLFSKGFFVNEDTWSIQSITYLDPTDGSTNTIKVLAK